MSDWNVCPKCDDLVDLPDGEAHDGEEITCWCGALLVAVSFTDGSMQLLVQDCGLPESRHARRDK